MASGLLSQNVKWLHQLGGSWVQIPLIFSGGRLFKSDSSVAFLHSEPGTFKSREVNMKPILNLEDNILIILFVKKIFYIYLGNGSGLMWKELS